MRLIRCLVDLFYVPFPYLTAETVGVKISFVTE
jgi:hypothetical protein